MKRRVKPCLALKMRGRTCEVENSCGTLSEEAANHSQPSLKQRHGRHRAQAWQAEGLGMACQYCQPSFNHPYTLARVGRCQLLVLSTRLCESTSTSNLSNNQLCGSKEKSLSAGKDDRTTVVKETLRSSLANRWWAPF